VKTDMYQVCKGAGASVNRSKKVIGRLYKTSGSFVL